MKKSLQETLKDPTAEKATKGQEATWPREATGGNEKQALALPASPPILPWQRADRPAGEGGTPPALQGGRQVHPALSVLIRLLDRGTWGLGQPPHKGATRRKGGPESPGQRSRGTCYLTTVMVRQEGHLPPTLRAS